MQTFRPVKSVEKRWLEKEVRRNWTSLFWVLSSRRHCDSLRWRHDTGEARVFRVSINSCSCWIGDVCLFVRLLQEMTSLLPFPDQDENREWEVPEVAPRGGGVGGRLPQVRRWFCSMGWTVLMSKIIMISKSSWCLTEEIKTQKVYLIRKWKTHPKNIIISKKKYTMTNTKLEKKLQYQPKHFIEETSEMPKIY